MRSVRAHSPCDPAAVQLLRTSVLLLLFAGACVPGERTLAPGDEHQHAARHNLSTDDDSVYRWSDPSSWPDGVVPAPGANVVIPLGRHLLLDTTPPAVRQITIAGTLEFADDQDLTLAARAIDVQGKLVIGASDRRHRHRAVITLLGTATEDAPFGAGAKGIIVTGGTIELHGARVLPWTRLGAHARAGESTIELERESSWRAGDRIAISSTGYDPADAEAATIESVNGTSVRLTRPLAHSHWGELQTIAGRQLDERAEVALLTRNIVIEGDSASSVSGYGAHVMIHPGSTAHIEGVEFHRVGQRGAMGRYPLHWHLAKETEGHYARDNSVWESFNRCMTIHGTNGVTLERNVCYDHAGHGYFLEDGVERGNVLAGNLGFGTHAPLGAARLLPSDERPATFWITNPDNDLHDNVAAGSEGFGIWYSLPEYPTGLSATRSVMPRHLPLRNFDGNTAHSNIKSGLWVDEGMDAEGQLNVAWYEPQADPVSGIVRAASFRGLVAYKNQALGAWFRGSNLRLVDAVLADNMSGAAFAAAESTLEGAFVVGVSENAGVNPRAWAPVRGFWFYDGPVGVTRSVFANFDARAGVDASALGFHPVNPWPISADNWLEKTTFVDAVPVTFDAVTQAFDATKSAVVVDRDGSLGGAPRSVFVPDSPLLSEGCESRGSWRAWACTAPVTQLVLRSDARLPEGVVVQRIGEWATQVRVSPVRYDSTFTTLTVPLNARIEVRTPGLTPKHLSLSTSSVEAAAILDITVPAFRADAQISQRGRTLELVDSDALESCVDCYGSDAATGMLRLRLRAENASHAIAVTIDRAGAAASVRAAAMPATPSVQRPPDERASSVLKYGSRALSARM